MIPENENHQYKLMGIIEKALCDVILVHGKIKKVSKYGNCVAIIFADGAVYKQPLVTRETSSIVLDLKK